MNLLCTELFSIYNGFPIYVKVVRLFDTMIANHFIDSLNTQLLRYLTYKNAPFKKKNNNV